MAGFPLVNVTEPSSNTALLSDHVLISRIACEQVAIMRYNAIATALSQLLAGHFPFSANMDTRPGTESDPTRLRSSMLYSITTARGWLAPWRRPSRIQSWRRIFSNRWRSYAQSCSALRLRRRPHCRWRFASAQIVSTSISRTISLNGRLTSASRPSRQPQAQERHCHNGSTVNR